MRGQILLTGATGFVGRHVAKRLVAERHDVVAVIREGTSERLPEGMGRVIETPDLFGEDIAFWTGACDGRGTVIHCAWHAKPDTYMTSERNLDCLEGTLRLARGAANAGIARFVGIGTCFEYDLSSDGDLASDAPLGPTTPYGAAKAATFLALSRWLAQEEVSFLWARLFYLHGPGEDPRRLVPYLHSRLAEGRHADLSSGTQVRDFLPVEEAARRIVDAASGNRHGPINICSGIGTTVREMAETIADIYGRRDLLAFGARADGAADPARVVGLSDRKDGR